MHLTRLLAAVALGLAGCPTGGPVEPAIQIGGGEVEFTAIDEGAELLIVFGPQGGYHVDGAFQSVGADPGDNDDLTDPRNPDILFDLVVAAGSLVLDGDLTQGLDPAPADAAPYTHQLLARRVLLDITDDDPFDGMDAVFSVQLTDATGLELVDSRDVVLAPHPLND